MRHNHAATRPFLARATGAVARITLAAALLGASASDAQCLLCTTSGTPTEESGSSRDLPLQIDVTADLDFARLVTGRGGGSVTVAPGGGPSTVRGSVAPIGGYGFSGRVVVTGTPGRTIRISMPHDIMLTSSNGRTAQVTGITTGLPPIARIGADGRLTFAFGGQLSIDGEADGDYRGRIPVTVAYE